MRSRPRGPSSSAIEVSTFGHIVSSPVSRRTRPRESISFASWRTTNSTGPELGWQDAKESPLFYLIFVIGFFYYGFSFLDYINERLRLNVDQSVQFARKNRGLAIAIGSIYSVMIWVPVELSALFDWSSCAGPGLNGTGGGPFHFLYNFVLNLLLWICASFAPIWSIVAATIAMNDLLDLKHKKELIVDAQTASTSE